MGPQFLPLVWAAIFCPWLLPYILPPTRPVDG